MDKTAGAYSLQIYDYFSQIQRETKAFLLVVRHNTEGPPISDWQWRHRRLFFFVRSQNRFNLVLFFKPWITLSHLCTVDQLKKIIIEYYSAHMHFSDPQALHPSFILRTTFLEHPLLVATCDLTYSKQSIVLLTFLPSRFTFIQSTFTYLDHLITLLLPTFNSNLILSQIL